MNDSTYSPTSRSSLPAVFRKDMQNRIKLDTAVRMYEAQQYDEAQQQCMELLAQDVQCTDGLNLLGLVLYEKGHYDVAVRMLGRALSIQKNNPVYHSNLGMILEAQQKYELAIAEYQQAVKLRSDYADAHYNLGTLYARLGRLQDAVGHLKRALVLNPRSAQAHCNLGGVYNLQRKFDKSIAHLDQAIALNANHVQAHSNKGLVLEALGEYQRALVSYDKALMLDPDCSDAQYNRSMLLLLHANYSYGWPAYEARWRSSSFGTSPRSYAQPLWNGQRLSEGRLYLWSEQGVGDEIMFAGLIPDLLRVESSVTLECDARLRPLFTRSFPEIDVVARDVSDSASQYNCPVDNISAHLPIGSLPQFFRKSTASFSSSATPFLKASQAECQGFRSSYGNGKKLVGLAWYSKNKTSGFKRSIELKQLSPLLHETGIDWISLQYGEHEALEAEAAQAGLPLLIDRSVDQMVDIDRFAAQVAAMDLVITIDNSTAHLAAALGCTVWLLLPEVPEWRWQLKRSDSPWYPTVRIFRQSKTDDWSAVIAQVREELASFSWHC